MIPLYLKPLPRAKYRRHRADSIEAFYDKHPMFTDCHGGRVLLVPCPIESEHDLEVVLTKIKEAAHG